MDLSIHDLNGFNEDQDVNLNKSALIKLGGILVLEKKLRTSFKLGLSGDKIDLKLRKDSFGKNEFPEPPSVSWWSLFCESFEDTTIIVLVVAAVVSLAIGMYEDPAKGWIEGAAILFAVFIVAIVTATNNYNKELQFRKLNAVKDDVTVSVVRDGKPSSVNVKDLVVGDIVLLNAGDKVPADGILVDGSDVTCDESSLTGESDDKKKSNNDSGDVFLLSGTSLSTGYAHMLVTAVGIQSRWGKTKAKLAVETVDTPLQEKLDTLANQIGNFGMVAAVLTFIAMISLRLIHPDNQISLYEYILKAFIMSVTIVVVAVPEGLPLAVTLSLAYSTQKMMKDNNLIRVLAACETMGNATNICSDKTGTLTQNRMTVVKAWIGGKSFDDATILKSKDIPAILVDLLCEGISVNTTANLIVDSNNVSSVAGNKTEGALLFFVKNQFNVEYANFRSNFNPGRGDRLITFSSSRKRMSVVLCKGPNKGGICYTKGASEIILQRSSHYINSSGAVILLDEAKRQELLGVIQNMAQNALRTVCVAHRNLEQISSDDDPEDLECSLVLDALFGIKDPLRPDVKEAVRNCQEAGIFVRMVTGDNIETAKAIAKECGILTEGGIALEGPAFRKLSPAKLDEILPFLQVLARSSPEDKHTLVTRLNGHALPESEDEWKEQHIGDSWEKDRDLKLPGYREEWVNSRKDGVGEVVGVTGDGSNDGPALKAADVGLSMGLSGTDVAKEASDIVILDDNFSSIVKSVMWGRAVFDNIRKFLQFQLTVNVVALTLTFVSAVTGMEPPLNAVMMLWVNLIMDTMGALALGTEPPSPTLLQRKPYKRNASLISNKMWRHIFFQFVFQMAVLSYLLLYCVEDFQTSYGSQQHLTIVFNTFVFCQVFNEINARSIDDNLDVFSGLMKNPIFLVIILFTSVAQVGIVQFGGDFVRTSPLTIDQWQKCISLAALSLPWGGLMRLVPVSENVLDFASLSPLMVQNQDLAKQNKAQNKGVRQNSLTVSFGLWFFVSTVAVAVALNQFGSSWSQNVKMLFEKR